MYIKSLEIKNIRSISNFRMEFPNPAGWHVIIGDNGAGKSSLIRSIALALLDISDINATAQDWEEWLRFGETQGSSELFIQPYFEEKIVQNRVTFERGLKLESPDSPNMVSNTFIREVIFRNIKSFDSTNIVTPNASIPSNFSPPPTPTPVSIQYQTEFDKNKWFSAGYGPFRRFSGGNQDKERIFKTNPNLGSLLSIFGEDIALTEALKYLKNQYVEELDAKSKGESVKPILNNLIKFVNDSKLLPHGALIDTVDSKGVFFKDGNGNKINTLQMSDGYRSMLCMTFELLRQLIRNYGSDLVFQHIINGNNIIDLPGVVLIDEVDVHLHPTWQTSVGEWFTKYFPKIQFIVSTHSPLVCRACENGSIWRLAAPGSKNKSEEIIGTDRDKLITGNILDAYGTEIFGKSPVRSAKTDESLKLLGKLNMLSAFGKISDEQEQQRLKLQQTLPTGSLELK